VRYRFADEPLARWLGLDLAEESPMAVLPLMAADYAVGSSRRFDDIDVPSPTAGPVLPMAAPDRERFHELDASARLTPSLLTSYPPIRRSLPDGTVMEVPEAELPDISLRAALAGRTSGSLSHFVPTGEKLASEDFWRLCRHAATPSTSDIAEPGASPVAVMMCANRVAGVERGVYRLQSMSEVSLISARPVADDLAAAALNRMLINFETSAVVISIVGDPRAASRSLGDRGYRILNMAAGITAARVCVLAAASGLGARVHNTYQAEAMARLLGIAGPPGPVPVFQIAVGALPVRPELRLGL
jgi:hypothetical protein